MHGMRHRIARLGIIEHEDASAASAQHQRSIQARRAGPHHDHVPQVRLCCRSMHGQFCLLKMARNLVLFECRSSAWSQQCLCSRTSAIKAVALLLAHFVNGMAILRQEFVQLGNFFFLRGNDVLGHFSHFRCFAIFQLGLSHVNGA